MLKHILLFLIPFTFLITGAQGQYIQIGNGGFANGNFGPITTDSTAAATYSRFAHIYPEASLGDLTHGDSISALVFRHRAFDSLRGSCNVKIFVKSTNQSDFGTSALNWLAETRSGMTQVFSGDIKEIVGSKPGNAIFIFNQGSKFGWDTAGGAVNLEVLIEYTQTTNQLDRINWYVENSFTVPAFVSVNESKFIFGPSTSGLDSITTGSSIIKPTMRLYIAKNKDDLELENIYALGTVPTLMNRADSIKVLYTNVGSDTVYNRKVYVEVSGVNSHIDSTVVASVAPYQQGFVYFTNHQPLNPGTETIKIILDTDSNLINNELIKNRTVSYNVFSHSDPFMASSGGVGFNGATGDFVGKFYVDGIKYLNQIKVDFNLGGRPFQLVMWDDDGTEGLPGTELFVSDTSISVGGTFIMPVLPRVQISGGFYIGIRQTSGNNVAFSFQEELPIRPSTFYFASPAQDTNWVSFSPGFDFNFNVQPRLQVANDLAVLNVISPMADQSILYKIADSIDLAASIINYGYQNQGSFIAKMEIKDRFNRLVNSYTRVVSLQSDDTLVVYFGKFSRYNIGDFTAEVSVLLNTDSVQDNNKKSIRFSLIKNHDVAVDLIFTPQDNDTFDLNREGFAPTVRVINYGEVTQSNFRVVGELINAAGIVVNRQETTVSLASNVSTIHSFDTIYLPAEGCFTYRSYTLLARDSFPINDTSFVRICSRKLDDIMIVSIARPKDNFKYAKGITLKPFITFRNDGRTNQDSTYFFVSVTGQKGELLYSDTSLQAITFFTTSQLIFKDLILDSIGDFVFTAIAYIANDQVRANDTIRSFYSVVTGNDIKLVKILDPLGVVPINSLAESPQVVVNNNGANTLIDAPISISVENNLGVEIYSDTILLNMVSFVTDTVHFKPLNFDILGDYHITAKNIWATEDELSSNDTLNSMYVVRYTKDVAVFSNLAPSANQKLELNENVNPSAQIINLGIDTIRDVTVLMEIRKIDNTLVLTDTLQKAELLPNTSAVLSSDLIFSSDKPGMYTLGMIVLNVDENTFNNTLVSPFEVVLRNDVSIVNAILPTADQKLYYKTTYKPTVKVRNNGIDEVTDASVSCIITLPDGGVLFNENRTMPIPAESELVVAFDSTLTHDQLDSAVARFVVTSSRDQISENNEKFVDFQFVVGLGVSDYATFQATIYPNPFTSIIHIVAIQPMVEIHITDLTGKVVYSALAQKSKEMAISPLLAAGHYMLEVVYSSGSEKYPIIKAN